MKATKRRRVVPIRYEDNASPYYTKLSANSNLSKEDKVDIDNNNQAKESVPSSKENRLKKKYGDLLITSVMDTCSIMKNNIRMKKARIKQLELKLVIQSELTDEIKLTVGRLMKQQSVKMEEVIRLKDARIEELEMEVVIQSKLNVEFKLTVGQSEKQLSVEMEQTSAQMKGVIRLKEVRIKELEMEVVTQSKLNAELKLTVGQSEKQLSVEMEQTSVQRKEVIRMKEARIKELEMEVVTLSKLNAEFKLTVGTLENQLSVEMEQTSVQMKEVQEQCRMKQELELVKEENISVKIVNKELHLEIKKLLNEKDLVGVKNLGDKWVANEKLDKAVLDLQNVNCQLELQKEKFTSKEEELSSCAYRLEKLEICYKELHYKHGKLEEELAMNHKNVYELNQRISEQEDTLATMKQTQVEIQLIVKEKTEHINDLQLTLQFCKKKKERKTATREGDKIKIKQKHEEIGYMNTNKSKVVEGLPSVAEKVDDGKSDVDISGSSAVPITFTYTDILGRTGIALETDSLASIEETNRMFQDHRIREEGGNTGSLVDIVGDTIINVLDESQVEKNGRHGDLSLPSTSGKGSMYSKMINKLEIFQDILPLPESLCPPLLSTKRSDSPAQTSHKTYFIRLKNINALLSYSKRPNLLLNEIVIPRSVDYDADDVPVEMDIISEEEIERQAKVDKEEKNKQVFARSRLKHLVADVVKTYLEGFYPRQTDGKEDSWVIKSDQEFSQLAEKFSKQFREEIMSEHAKLVNVGLEGFILTPSHKEVMLEQIIFYFCVREEVYKSLICLVRPTHFIFQSCLSQYSESLMLELIDSHVSIQGRLVDLNMTDDSRLYISCQIQRRWRSEL